jgi:hypothetical protein
MASPTKTMPYLSPRATSNLDGPLSFDLGIMQSPMHARERKSNKTLMSSRSSLPPIMPNSPDRSNVREFNQYNTISKPRPHIPGT